MNTLHHAQREFKLINPHVYIDYLSEHKVSTKEILAVMDNGHGYDWEILYLDSDNERRIFSFHPIDVIEWLSKFYDNGDKNEQ